MNENEKTEKNNADGEEREKIHFSQSDFDGLNGGSPGGNPYGDPRYAAGEGARREEPRREEPYGEDGRFRGSNPYSANRQCESYSDNDAFVGENPYSSHYGGGESFGADEAELTAFDAPEAKKTFNYIGAGFALFVLISTVVALVIQLVGMALNEDILSNIWFVNIITPVALYLFALPVLLILMSKLPTTSIEGRSMKIKEWLVYFVVCFGLMYIGSFISEYVMSVLSSMTGKDYSNALNDLIDFNNMKNIWITAIFTVVVAPIGEELVFRKLLIDRTRKYGAAVSIILSALMFGLMHGNFYQLFYAFLLGLVLGYMYYTTGRVLPVIAMHAAINFFGSVVTVLLSHGIDLEALDDISATMEFISEHGFQLVLLVLFTVFAYACMVCAVVIPAANHKKIKLEKGELPIPATHIKRVLILNAGMIVMWVVFILQFALSLM